MTLPIKCNTFVWNIPIKDAKPFIQEKDYKSSKSMMDDLGNVTNSELTLVYLTD